MTGQNEVSCFGTNGNGDDNCNWRVLYDQGEDGALRLQHVSLGGGGNHYLHSHGNKLPDWGMHQQEVTVMDGKDGNDLWKIQETTAVPHA